MPAQKNIRSGMVGCAAGRPSWQLGYAGGVLLLFCFQLLALLVPLRVHDLHSFYGLLVLGALSGVYLSRRFFSDGREMCVVLLWAVWCLLSRWLNRDFYLMIDSGMIANALLTVLFLSLGLQLDAVWRERFLRALTVVYAGFFLLAALAAIFVALTDTYLHIPPENIWITVLQENSLTTINLLSTVRLMTAERLYIAWALLLLQCFRARRAFARILLLLSMLILHFGISFCYSRTVQICFSLSCGMLAFLLCWRRLQARRGFSRLGVAILLLFVFAFAAFKSFPLFNRFTSELHSIIAPRFQQYYTSRNTHPLNTEDFGLILPQESITDAVSEAAPSSTGAAAAGSHFIDQRKIVGNFTLSERTYIWKSIVPRLRECPSILLRGQSSKQMMVYQNKYINTLEYKTHMHNMYLQTLMLLGLPGLLAVLVWTVLLVRKMLRCFFGRRESVPLRAALYSIPLAAVFVFNLLEINIFAGLDISGLVFFLLAGLFLAEVRELPADQTRSPAP